MKTGSGVRSLLRLGACVCSALCAIGATGAIVVDSKVDEAVARDGRARVLMFLSVPEVESAPLAVVRREVARSQDAVLEALRPDGFELLRRFGAVPAIAGNLTAKGLARLVATPGVVRVSLDEGGTGGLAEAVPLTHSDAVQALGYTGLGVTVAILDSGMDTDHPDLADDLDGEACFCSTLCCPGGVATRVGPGSAEDDHGHGSNVAGIVTSRGIVAHNGVAPDAKVVAIKVLDRNNAFCCTSDVVAGLDWILSDRPDVDIVNMSLGTFQLFAGDCDAASASTMAFSSVINALRDRGTLSFVSAMNNASGTGMGAPACIASALSVGAVYDANLGGPLSYGVCTDPTSAPNQVVCFSNSDSSTDLFAPGAAITSDYLGGGTSTFFGTSQASPHAAGCAADLLQSKPSATPDEIEAALEASGVPVIDPKNGLTFPALDCLAALEEIGCSSAVDCDDGLFCNGAEVCSNHSCHAGVPPTCDDGDACTSDTCGTTTILFQANLEAGASGWTHAGVGDTWHLAAASCFGVPLPSTMFVSNGNAGPACIADSSVERSRLLSPTIALPASGTLRLTFDALSFDQAGRCVASSDADSHDVRITTDNGVTWTLLNDCTALADGTGNVTARTFDLSAFAGQSVKVYFFYNTFSQLTGHTFAVDNVTVTRTMDGCSNAPRPNGSPCDDNDPSTCTDVCSAGLCAGVPVPVPPEVGNSVILAKNASDEIVSWTEPPGSFNVYRGLSTGVGGFVPYSHTCFDPRTAGPSHDPADPGTGGFFYYLVTRVDACRESIPGRNGAGAPIPNHSPCP